MMMIILFGAGENRPARCSATLCGSWRRVPMFSNRCGRSRTAQPLYRGGAALRTTVPWPLSPRRRRHHLRRHGPARRFPLAAAMGSGDRDPGQFDAPHEFRLDRPGGKGHITFGKGAHFCVGAALARLEAQIVLRTVLDRTSRVDAVDIGPGCRAFSSAAANVWS